MGAVSGLRSAAGDGAAGVMRPGQGCPPPECTRPAGHTAFADASFELTCEILVLFKTQSTQEGGRYTLLVVDA